MLERKQRYFPLSPCVGCNIVPINVSISWYPNCNYFISSTFSLETFSVTIYYFQKLSLPSFQATRPSFCSQNSAGVGGLDVVISYGEREKWSKAGIKIFQHVLHTTFFLYSCSMASGLHLHLVFGGYVSYFNLTWAPGWRVDPAFLTFTSEFPSVPDESDSGRFGYVL